MFWLGVKVLFWRQIFGFKHRKVISSFSLIVPICITLLLSLSWPSELPDSKPQRYLYSGSVLKYPGFFGFPHSLTVIVMPKNFDTSSLMTKAQSVLQSQYSNSLGLELHQSFAKSPEDLNRSLADSAVWPSIGVEFHNVTKRQLKYTLRPVIASNISENSTGNDDDISPYSLLLQAAIDAAYMQTYFPDLHFPKLQNFEEDMGNGSAFRAPPKIDKFGTLFVVIVSHILVSCAMLILISFLATYIVRDKSNGVRELLCINGLPRWMVNTSWLFTFTLLATILALVEWIIFKLPSHRLTGITAPALLVYLIVYHWTATFFVYLIANIFTSQVVSVLLIIVYYIFISPYSWMVLKLEGYFVAQAFISLLPNVGGIVFCVAAWDSYYEFGKSISLMNMFSTSGKFISPGLALLMMLISVALCLVLGMYFDAVKPGPYGRARPWYLLTKKEKPTTDRWFDTESPSEALVHEPIKDGVPIGLECVNLVKKYGTHKALNKVNLKIIKNDITVLLGHNGAGKTTLFSILCGMSSPTSGDVYTDEYNVFEGNNIKKFRSVLGYCPQENLLMQELTVHEHLVVFGILKGLVMSEAVEYSYKWTQMFDMFPMRSTQAKKLSGGSKRKLCLAIAMTGSPQYVILDEPSAGLDVESTEKFHDIVLEEIGNCTVVITTHNMDEAEMLGEHIAILAHGELKCYGSASFLKKMLDTGYRLNCSLIGSVTTEEAIKTVKNMIPGTIVLFKTNHSVTFSLPVSRNSEIPDLLRRLESQFGEKVASTLSPSSLDDVFLKVHTDMGVKIAVDELPVIPEEKIRHSSCHFIELFKKLAKSLLTPRMVTMIFFVIVLPNVGMFLCMFDLNFLLNYGENILLQRSLSIDSFPKGGHGILGLLFDESISDFGLSAPMWRTSAFSKEGENIDFAVSNSTYLFKYRSKVLFALGSPDTPSVTFSSGKSDRDVSEIYTALMKALFQGNTSIITYKSPFLKRQTFSEVSVKCPMPDDGFILLGLEAIPNVPLTFLISSSYFVLIPHLERITVFKHLQLMTGLLPVAYWFANLVFDMLMYIFSCVLVIIITASMDHTKVFLKPNVMYAFILILFFYGLSSITYSYVWSFRFGSRGWALLTLLLFNFLFPYVMDLIFVKKSPWPGIIECVNAIFPYRMLSVSMTKLIEWAIKKRDCMNCPPANHEEACFYVNSNPLLAVLKSALITLAVQAIVWFVLLLLLDHGMGRKLWGGIARVCCGDIKPLDRNVDPEVALEKKRVKNLIMTKNKDKRPELVVDGLGKNYSCTKTAVYDVTFAAERGECFGLVGVNGSGKTTTFRMLAALMSPTKGTALIEGTWKVDSCEYKYMKRVGYCPQYNGLLTDLSGRTILKLFGRLSGVPRSQINELVDKWINALDMAEISKRPCGHYSGGNKRKLSLAIALIGNAPVALLDEPTAGVDPVVRRRIWEILTHRLENNQTIILTSHTMSECETICDRLTILVKGVMKCLGPIPTLKKTFGKRSVLEVKFKPNSTIKEQDVVKSKIQSEFRDYIILEDRLLNRLIFRLNTENTKMYDLFATMLRIQSDYKVVEDFTLVEAPLEQVFMVFAKKQPDKKKKKY